ncbi:uncharacterized protein CXorf38 homolog [Gastrophryne carolinensis]
MALSSLLHRLNCKEYKNWMKAGYCLQILQSCLQGHIEAEMRSFHRRLLDSLSSQSGAPRSRCHCRARGKQFQPDCPVCREWKTHILEHHNNRNGEVHWANSNPSLWPTHYWEVAKVYLPRGHTHSTGPKQCDAAALLNLINSCDHFKVSNISKVREVIKCRNDLMHSSEMKVSSSWLKDFGQKMQEFLYEFKHVPSIVNQAKQIQEVLLSDWSVEDLVIHEVDGFHTDAVGGGDVFLDGLSLNELEINLINQLFEELYYQKEEYGALSMENLDSCDKLKSFLLENKDLSSVFQKDLNKLELLMV